ncbi:MAG TPA: hypothetical protein VIH59_07795 [Candidatus Tectomicrobia bacterium]
MEVGSNLFMRATSSASEVVLSGARIGGQLNMTGATVTGQLNMDSLHVGSSLFMRDGATFTEVVLRSARIEGQLDMTGATVTGKLDMDSFQVGSSLLLRDGATFADVVLAGARIGSQLHLSEAIVTGELNMDSMQVSGNVVMQRGTFKSPISTRVSTIGTTLDLLGVALPSLDLTGTRIDGELRLALDSFAATWLSDAHLILQNTQVGVLRDIASAWPNQVELDGFTYARIVGPVADSTDMGRRSIQGWKAWLAKQQVYSQQPYEQLAKVLREAGRRDTANEMLYASRERERAVACRHTHPGNSNSCELLHWPWLWASLLNLLIGYGYRIYYALYWTIGAVIAGMIVLQLSGQGPKHGMQYYGLAYSIDMLLPILELRKHHSDKIELEGWARGYFYVHKAFGYVLALFLIAGLSGLAK